MSICFIFGRDFFISLFTSEPKVAKYASIRMIHLFSFYILISFPYFLSVYYSYNIYNLNMFKQLLNNMVLSDNIILEFRRPFFNVYYAILDCA